MKNGMAMPETDGARCARRAATAPRSATHRLRAIVCATALTLVGANAFAISKDQAKRIYDRIAGVPATDAQLNTLAAGTASNAAMVATQDPSFYNNTIRNLAAPWTNRDQSVFVPLNDYIATVIGMVRDDVPFNTLLSADILYIADSAANVPAYSPANNDLYQALDNDGANLSVHLVKTTQSAVTGCAFAPALSKASAPMHAAVLSTTLMTRGKGASRTNCLICFSIPFMFTSAKSGGDLDLWRQSKHQIAS